jgi:cytidylate kinase
MIVAIDGPAGAGKSTTAREVARALGYAYIDTGAMYRAVGLVALERGFTLPRDAEAIQALPDDLCFRFAAGGDRLYLGSRDVSAEIRRPQVGEWASKVATLPGVRSAVVALQRELGRAAEMGCGGAVLEGRDIGPVVFADAALKIFLTASPEIRAKRRLEQWEKSGRAGDLPGARADVEQRDERDINRSYSPLVPAGDAVQLSTDKLSADQVVQAIVALARERS